MDHNMALLRIEKVLSLPSVLTANTAYLVLRDGTELFDLYVTNSDGSSVKHVSSKEEAIKEICIFSDEKPSVYVNQVMWFNTAKLTLYFKYNDGTNVNWVEPTSSIQVPEFGGNGTAPTMAHSDHTHDSIVLGSEEW